MVVSCIYKRLPKLAALVITWAAIKRLLEAGRLYAKKKWEENPYLREFVKGGSAGFNGGR